MTTAKKKADQPVWVGESETAAYYRATHGSEALTEDEINYLNDMIPAKDYNRFYARFGVALGRKNLSGIINLSDGNYPLKNATPTQPAVRNNQRNTMFAIGYDWNPARLELEYLWTKSFIYGPNPVFQPPAPTMSLHAVVSDQVLMANIYYDYRGFAERAYPYLVISLGGVHHRERMALTNPQSGRGTLPEGRNFGWITGIGPGIRFGAFAHWFVDFQYRYFKAGHVNFKPEPLMYLRGNYSFWFLGFSVIYMF